MVTIDISDKYIKKDIPNKQGHLFHEVTIPRGTMVGSKDLSFYKFLTSDLYTNSEKGFSLIAFPPEKMITLKKAVKNQETGEYDVLTECVNANTLSEAVYDSYKAYKREQEKAVPAPEAEQPTVGEPAKKSKSKGKEKER